MRSVFLGSIVLLGVFSISPAHAWCPNGYYRDDFGLCLPGGGTVINAVPGVREVVAQTGAPALEQWLQASRNSARVGASPIPSRVRQFFAGRVRADVLDRARFKVGDSGYFNAAGNTLRHNGNVRAVTLVDVIVFRNARDVDDMALWAHELFHVQQFLDWGVRDFSIRYVRDADAVERPAYQRQQDARNWVSASSPPSGYMSGSSGASARNSPPQSIRISLNGGMGDIGYGYRIVGVNYRHVGPSPNRHEFSFRVVGPGYSSNVFYTGDNDRPWQGQLSTVQTPRGNLQFAFSQWNDGAAHFNFAWR